MPYLTGTIAKITEKARNLKEYIEFNKTLDNQYWSVYNSEVSSSQRGVAQLGRALRSGRRGRRFKSCRLDLDAFPTCVETI